MGLTAINWALKIQHCDTDNSKKVYLHSFIISFLLNILQKTFMQKKKKIPLAFHCNNDIIKTYEYKSVKTTLGGAFSFFKMPPLTFDTLKITRV